MVAPTGAELFREAFDAELTEAAKDHSPSEFSAAGRNRTKANPAGEDEAWWRVHGPEMVDNWLAWRRKTHWWMWTTPDGEPAIELSIEVDVGIDRPLKGYIDRVMVVPESRQPCILDLKSGSRTPESDLQLAVYRYGLAQRWPDIDIRYGAYWMARKGQVSEVVDLSRYTPEMIQGWFGRFWQAISLGLFIPHITNLCRACSHRDFCVATGGRAAHRDPDHPSYVPEANVN